MVQPGTERLKTRTECKDLEMIAMKWMPAIAVFIILSLAAIVASGEVTDYQKGVANGLKIGLFMGEYYGRGQYVVDYAGQYNTYLDQYYQFLWASFAGNQTLMNEFLRSPIIFKNYKKSSSGVAYPDASDRIYGYPAPDYYTWIGAVPGTKPQNPSDALPGA
jgi:hypothetical protein